MYLLWMVGGIKNTSNMIKYEIGRIVAVQKLIPSAVSFSKVPNAPNTNQDSKAARNWMIRVETRNLSIRVRREAMWIS